MTERQPPCLYLLWPRSRSHVPEALVPAEYALRVYRDTDEEELLDLQGSDGEPMSEAAWHEYRDRLLPNGLLLIEDLAGNRLVATAGAGHNPNAGRYYFPFGGELGYVIVRAEHRRRGLGRAVCVAAVRRLLAAGYESIRVCVQEHRAPALRAYLGLGFEPFLHSTEVVQRWQRVCGALDVPFTPDAWPTQTT